MEKKFKRGLSKIYAGMIVALCVIGGQPIVGYFFNKIAERAYKKLLSA